MPALEMLQSNVARDFGDEALLRLIWARYHEAEALSGRWERMEVK